MRFADLLDEKVKSAQQSAERARSESLFANPHTWMDSAQWARHRAAGDGVKTSKGHPSYFSARTAKAEVKREEFFIEVASLSLEERIALQDLLRMGARFARANERVSQSELKQEWRRLARATHPDTSKSPAEHFMRVREAYRILSSKMPKKAGSK